MKAIPSKRFFKKLAAKLELIMLYMTLLGLRNKLSTQYPKRTLYFTGTK